MASEGPRNLILEEGIFFLEDPEIGRRVHEFDENKFPFQTEECLDFIEKNILNDTVSLQRITVYGLTANSVFGKQ